MGHNNGIISTPINIQGDIGYILGVAGSDIGTLCSSPSINKWAKYKPYRSPSHITSDNNRRAANYGMVIPTYQSIQTLVPALVNGSAVWTYGRPRGNSTTIHERYRPLDFAGYNHYCIRPVGEVGTVVPIESDGDATISFDVITLPTNNLSLTDFSFGGVSLSNFYLGVILYRSPSDYHYATASSPIGTAQGLSIDLTNAVAGSWNAYFFLSAVQIQYDQEDTEESIYLSACFDSFEQIEMYETSKSLIFIAYGEWNVGHTSISIHWVAYNIDSAVKTVTPTFNLYKNTTGEEPTSGEILASVSPGAITVPAGSISSPGVMEGDTSLNYNDYSSSYFWWLGAAVPDYSTTYILVDEADQPMLVNS